MPNTVIFDLGAVLIDWNPRYLYRKLIRDEEEIEAFLRDVCDPAWNVSMDGGRPFAEAVAAKVREFPEKRALIEAYHHRWIEMIHGPIAGTLRLLEALHHGGVPLFALTNWSAETFPLVRHDPNYAFLDLFQAIVVSGEIGMVKPDPAIFRHMLAVADRRAEDCLFIDDSQANCASADALGFTTHLFVNPETLGTDLNRLGLLPST